MPTGMTWQGVPAFLAHLTGIPTTWKAEAQRDAQAAAAAQARTVTAVYSAHRRTGALANGVQVTATRTGARVITTAPHTRYFEYGTRYMAGARVFRPAATEAGAAYLAAAERRVHAPLILR